MEEGRCFAYAVPCVPSSDVVEGSGAGLMLTQCVMTASCGGRGCAEPQMVSPPAGKSSHPGMDLWLAAQSGMYVLACALERA